MQSSESPPQLASKKLLSATSFQSFGVPPVGLAQQAANFGFPVVSLKLTMQKSIFGQSCQRQRHLQSQQFQPTSAYGICVQAFFLLTRYQYSCVGLICKAWTIVRSSKKRNEFFIDVDQVWNKQKKQILLSLISNKVKERNLDVFYILYILYIQAYNNVILTVVCVIIKLKPSKNNMEPAFIENSFLAHGQEHFYEVNLKQKNSIIRVYDSTAKLRLTRKLNLPPGQAMACQNYLIIYDQNMIHLRDVTAINSQGRTCNRMGVGEISAAVYSADINLFFIVDREHKIYYLMEDGERLVLKEIYNPKKKELPTINKFYCDKQGLLYLHFADEKILRKLKFDWKDNDKLELDEIIPNIVDVYIRHHWSAVLYEQQGGLKLSINNETFISTVEASPYTMMKANVKSFIYLDLHCSRLILIHNGQIVDYEHDTQILAIKKDYKFLFQIGELSEKYIRLKIYLYEGIEGQFTQHSYDIHKYEGSDLNAYIQSNIHLIMKSNGLIHPNFNDRVIDYLRDNGVGISFQANYEELSYLFLETLLRLTPEIAAKLASSLAQNRRESYVVTEFGRYVSYIEYLFKKISSNLAESLQNIGNNERGGYEDLLKQIRGAINFLSILEQIVWEEVYEPENASDMSQKYGKSHEQKYSAFFNTIQKGKSLYLIASIFGSDNLIHRVRSFIKKIEDDHEMAIKLYANQHQWKTNNLIPFLCCQYLLGDTATAFIKLKNELLMCLLDGQNHFYRVAYFYVALLQPISIPYITNTSTKDLIYFLVERPIWSPEIQIQEQVREELPMITSRALVLEDVGILKYLCQMSIYYQEYKSCLGVLLSRKTVEEEQIEKVLTYFVLCNRVLLGYEWAEEKGKDRDEKEKVMRRLGRVCERNSKIKEVFKIQNKAWKGVMLEEIRQNRGEEIEEIRNLLENY